ncbi:MAG: hypothetical protein JKY33_02085, partial [Bacteroidia bacterium]|nr:hypothetical protein [Bacteroidia bacterium]
MNPTENKDFELSNPFKDFDIGLILTIVKSSLLIFIVLFLISISGIWLFLRYTPPIFKGITSIKVASNRSIQLGTFVGFNRHEQEALAKEQLQEEVELLRSPFMVNKALNKMHYNVQYFVEGEVLTQEQYETANYHVEFNIKDNITYQIRFEILFVNSNQFTLKYLGQERIFTFGKWHQTEIVDFKITLDNPNLVSSQQQDKYYFIINNIPEVALKEFAPNLQLIITNSRARTLLIYFSDQNKYKAADFLNHLVEAYAEYGLEKRKEGLISSANFIEEQMLKIESQILQSTNKILNYSFSASKLRNLNSVYESEGIIKLGSNDFISKIKAEILKFKNELQKFDTIIAYINTNKDFHHLILEEEDYGAIIQQLSSLQNQRNFLKNYDSEYSPYIKPLNQQIKDIKKTLTKSITFLKNQNLQNLELLRERIFEYSEYEGKRNVSSEELEYLRVTTAYKTQKKYYEGLLQKHANILIQAA